MVAGKARVEVLFTVDADGLLTVTAKEEETGKHQHIEVKPNYGLTEQEIMDMLRQSMINAKEDVTEKLLTEKRIAAKQLILTVASALKNDKALLTPAQHQKIHTTMEQLQETIRHEDREAIDKYIKKLEKLTQDFAQKRMDKYIGQALKGTNIEEV